MNESNKKYVSLYLDGYKHYNTSTKNAYIFYVSLLIKYNNNIILNATNSRLSKLTGVSKNSITLYLRILKGMKLISFKGKTLYIHKQEKPASKNKMYKMHLYRSLKFNNTKLIIELKLIKNNLVSQNFAINAKKILSGNSRTAYINKVKFDSLALKTKKRFIRKIQKYGFRDNLNDNIILSSRTIARILNVSQTKALGLLNSLENSKLVSYSKKYIKLGYMSFDDFTHYVEYYNEYISKTGYSSFSYKKGIVYLNTGIGFNYILKGV